MHGVCEHVCNGSSSCLSLSHAGHRIESSNAVSLKTGLMYRKDLRHDATLLQVDDSEHSCS